MKKALYVAISFLLIFSMLAGCSQSSTGTTTAQTTTAGTTTTGELEPKSTIPVINGGNPVTLQVALNQLNPTVNTTPTPEQPEVRSAARDLADEFMKIHPNVKIEFVYQAGDKSEWYTTLLAANNAPDIIHIWGPDATQGDYYVVLDEILDQPNEYYPSVKTWREQFPEYIWDTGGIKDIHGRIGTLPVALFPGPATGYFYNMSIFDELKLKVPVTWEEFIDTAKIINDAGYIAVVPRGASDTLTVYNWDWSFSFGPLYSAWLVQNKGLDYDNDGKVSYAEQLRFAYEGNIMLSNPDNGYAIDIFRQQKKKIDVFPEGWQGLDYAKLWNEGKVAMKEAGLWELPPERANTQRPFEFGLFPPPVMQKDSSEYTVEVEFTKGPYKPAASEYFTIMNPARQNRPEANAVAAIQFLKWLTVPENNEKMIFELKGSVLGAVRGVGVPPELADWVDKTFPALPSFPRYRTAFSGEEGTPGEIVEMYLLEMITEEEFITRMDAEVKKNVESAIKNAQRDNFDPSSWKKGW